MKKVSVIVPTYKRSPDFLEIAVESLLNQTYKNIEIIIIDDSPDDYIERENIKLYAENLEDDRVIYRQNEKNLGGSLARNRGIEMSTGDYITFLDDDDMYKPDKIKAQVDFMEKHDYDMSFANMLIKNTSGAVIDVRDYHDIESLDNDYMLKYHILHHATGTPTYMYKRQALFSIGLFDDAIMGQEFYLMLKTIEAGLKIGYLNRYDVIVFRHAEEAISTGPNKIKGEKILYERKKEYFHKFSNKEIRFIKMRHYAVMAIAHKRNSKTLGFFLYALRSFIASPISLTKEAIKYVITWFREVFKGRTS